MTPSKPRYRCPWCECSFFELYKDRCPVCLGVYRVPRGGGPAARERKASSRSGWRKLLANRDGRTCANCGATENLTIDHIVPLSKGGKWELSNLQFLCSPCNQRKADKMPEVFEQQGQVRPLRVVDRSETA